MTEKEGTGAKALVDELKEAKNLLVHGSAPQRAEGWAKLDMVIPKIAAALEDANQGERQLEELRAFINERRVENSKYLTKPSFEGDESFFDDEADKLWRAQRNEDDIILAQISRLTPPAPKREGV